MNNTDQTNNYLNRLHRIRDLYERFTNATATKEELAEFFALAADPVNEPIFDSLTSDTWDELVEKANKFQHLKNAPVRKIKPRPLIKWSAAAAILLFGFGTYFFVNKKTTKPEQSISITKTNDVAPASNRAILILSTGQQITLDSVKNGTLAKVGNITISKTDNGKLLYASVDSKVIQNETSLNTLTTPRGGIYELTLPDGTKAWLNAASRIDYPTRFTGKKREVFISGEVYFEVAHDAGHPFLVTLTSKTQDGREGSHWMQIEVLGTHFNVNTYDEAKTTLLEGSVKVTAHGRSITIKPGEQTLTGFTDQDIKINKSVDTDKVMAWRFGKMVLTDVSAKQLMTEISRWYDMDIEYRGKIPDKQFYGSIRRDVPLSTVLHALNAYGIETLVEGKKIIVRN